MRALPAIALSCLFASACGSNRGQGSSGASATAGASSGSPSTGRTASSAGATAGSSGTSSTMASASLTSGGASSGAATAASSSSGMSYLEDAGNCAPPFDPNGSYPNDAGRAPFEQFLVQLPADTWFSLPDSSFLGSGVQPAMDAGVWGVVGPAAVILAWSGGAWDDRDRQLLLWGGGHADYSGDEVYAFEVPTHRWSRLTNPDPGPFDQDPLADGQPDARHTYDGLQWLPDRGLFFAFGGAMATTGHGTTVTWTFDPSSATWTNQDATPPTISSDYNVATVYDPSTGYLWLRSVQEMYTYDLATNAWTLEDNLGYGSDWTTESNWGGKRGVLDPTRHLFFAIGNGALLVWDLTQALGPDGGATTPNPTGRVTSQWMTQGGDAVLAAGPAGADYDPVADEIVAWNGGPAYALDLNAKVWSPGATCGAPGAPVADGTFGRWRYLPEYNVFILVNGPNDAVSFYKHRAGGP